MEINLFNTKIILQKVRWHSDFRLNISFHFCYTACLNVSIVMRSKGTFNGPAPGWMEISFTFKVIFIKALHFPLLFQSCRVLQVLHLQLMSYNTIANTGNDRPWLLRNIILPSPPCTWGILQMSHYGKCSASQVLHYVQFGSLFSF